jgi:hypothetical protein
MSVKADLADRIVAGVLRSLIRSEAAVDSSTRLTARGRAGSTACNVVIVAT